MNLAHQFLKNFTWLSLGEIGSRAAGFIILVWLARHFSPAVYGQWSWALGFVTIFAVLADFGFSTLAVRELSRYKEKTAQYIDNIIIIKLILGIITFGVIFIIVQLLDKDLVVVRLVYFLGIFTILNTFATFFQSIFRANEKMYYETAARILQSLALLALVSWFIFNQGTIIDISYSYIFGALVSIIFSVIFIWRYFSRFFFGINLKVSKQIIKQAWPFALSAVAIIIYYHIDIVFLGIYKTDADVGYYQAAYNIIMILTAAIGLLVMSIFPSLASLFKSSLVQFKDLIKYFYKLIYLFSLPLIILIFFNAPTIIKIIYGKQYLDSTDYILQILVWSVLILYNYAIFGIGLSASDQQKIYLKGVLMGAVFNTVTNLIFIPLYGYYGAAMTTVFTELLVCSYMSYKFLKSQNMKMPIIFILKTSIAACSMVGLFLTFNLFQINLIISSIISLILYILIVLVLKTFENNPVIFLKKIINK